MRRYLSISDRIMVILILLRNSTWQYLEQYKFSSMKYLIKPKHLEEGIIRDLRSSEINKRKAEVQLFSEYSYFITIGGNKYSLCKEDLFDAYSDAVLAVINSISNGHYENRSSLKTYIYQIYHNKCLDLIRKNTNRKNIVHKTEAINEMQEYLPDNSISIIERLIKQSDLESIKQKMNNLSENCRQVLLLSADGYSDKEIAVMGRFKTADVVKTCRLRSLKKLRKLVSWPNGCY